MIFRRCPSIEELSQFASGHGSARITRHIVKCEPCRQNLAQYCEDEELLNALRAVKDADDLDEKARLHLLELCLAVVREKDGKAAESAD